VPRPEPFDYPVRGFAPLPFARSIAAGQAQSIRVKDRESGESSGPKRETRPAVRSQLVTGLWRMSGHPAIQQPWQRRISSRSVFLESTRPPQPSSVEPPYPYARWLWEGWYREASPYPDQGRTPPLPRRRLYARFPAPFCRSAEGRYPPFHGIHPSRREAIDRESPRQSSRRISGPATSARRKGLFSREAVALEGAGCFFDAPAKAVAILCPSSRRVAASPRAHGLKENKGGVAPRQTPEAVPRRPLRRRPRDPPPPARPHKSLRPGARKRGPGGGGSAPNLRKIDFARLLGKAMRLFSRDRKAPTLS